MHNKGSNGLRRINERGDGRGCRSLFRDSSEVVQTHGGFLTVEEVIWKGGAKGSE